MSSIKKILPILFGLVLIGCVGAAGHKAAVQGESGTDTMTVGKVQRVVRAGMSGAEVAEALGSPNIVSTDENRREVWIYDKVSTDTVYSSSSGGVSALFIGSAGATTGGVGPSYGSSAGASSVTQRTLTVIIKFGDDGKVRDFAYHSSKF